MASVTQKRLRRVVQRVRRPRRLTRATTATPMGGRWREPPFTLPDDSDGGAGVREPRRPAPAAPAGAVTRRPSPTSGSI